MKKIIWSFVAGAATVVILALIAAPKAPDKPLQQPESIPIATTQMPLAPPPSPPPPNTPSPPDIALQSEPAHFAEAHDMHTRELLDAPNVTRVASSELGVQTHKWEGRVIETTAHCFYADADEYRCVTGGQGRVDFSTLFPDSAREKIESQCDTTEKMAHDQCRVTIRFVYQEFHQMDIGGLIGHMTIVQAKDGLGAIITTAALGRKRTR